ncbi:Lon protease C-terminal proteolytic domain-containing protein [Vararia minispora EC-137]|uniref:Lon protease C-terminal proteolytic domain-containing protein n=1 Tax=Vararia minispora EC-137 TaxID=1314806 RepID=A0ACB8QNR1_9AGAM|nr:Lon protease C-terminal proteolytic domain-containing protein [Vararia minispora EC-137]
MAVPASLAVVGLPYPAVLLPGASLALPLDRAAVDALASTLDPKDPHPRLAAVPLVPAPDGAPGPSPRLHTHGVSARATQLVRASARAPQSFVLTLRAEARIRLHPPAPDDKHPAVAGHSVRRLRVSALADTPPAPETVHAFKAAALKLLDRLAHDGAQGQRRRDAWARLATLVENADDARAPGVADALVAMLGVEYNDKLHMLTLEPNALLAHVTALLVKHSTTLGIAQSMTSSLNRQQREHFLRQQLAAVRAELEALQKSADANASSGSADLDAPADESDPDGMQELRKKIERLAQGTEERRVAANEWKRLKRIPSASAEWGVIRTYLDWLTSLPWPASAPPPPPPHASLPTPQFLARARAQLDEDHYGLERVKRRLIEYLAVVRLLETQADALTPPPQKQRTAKGPILLYVRPVPSRPRAKNSDCSYCLCRKRFIGPPGTGKTSLGASIARALGRPFERIALGGVRDEGEIRGHRRTYVAAGPGAIVQALRRAGRVDPVVLLDEVDKVGHGNFQGDPAAALLEVLDPEQNHTFTDHYINFPVDLSQILFICTANSLDTIAPPLLDRCEIVQLSGYTSHEKTHIARRFLLPKLLARNGLPHDRLHLSDDVLQELVHRYTREAGVRGLERAVAGVVRFKAVEWAESGDGPGVVAAPSDALVTPVDALATPTAAAPARPTDAPARPTDAPAPPTDALAAARKPYNPRVLVDDLEAILGVARWDPDEREREARRGVVYGLVVTGMGEGEVMPVETIAVPRGGAGGAVRLTGSLGDVIKESGELALSWVKTHAYDLGITSSPSHDPLAVREIDVHLHLPAGAQKKDGPSAGVAITCAFVSLLTGACVPADVAMTGEITLRGRVTPVGGIKEKVLGAHRAGIRKVILPHANRKDVMHDVPEDVREAMEFAFVRTLREGLEEAFGRGVLGWRAGVGLMHTRL